jgi:hypothetical protein
MTMHKTPLDVRREQVAHRLNGHLIGTALDVTSGGRRGPYTLSVGRLSERRLRRVIAVLKREGLL